MSSVQWFSTENLSEKLKNIWNCWRDYWKSKNIFNENIISKKNKKKIKIKKN